MEEEDKKFKDLFQAHKPEKAPADFSKKVMNEIFSQVVSKAYRPVFGKWFLPSFGVAFFIFIAYAISTLDFWGNSDSPGTIRSVFSNISPKEMPVVGKMGSVINDFFIQVPSTVWVILFTSLSLILFDWMFSYLKQQKTK